MDLAPGNWLLSPEGELVYIHLHTIPYSRKLRARKGAEVANAIWELFGGVRVFQVRSQGRKTCRSGKRIDGPLLPMGIV